MVFGVGLWSCLIYFWRRFGMACDGVRCWFVLVFGKVLEAFCTGFGVRCWLVVVMLDGLVNEFYS